MPFVNTLFPNPKLIHDMQVTLARPTTIVGNNVNEYRITKQRHMRHAWNWPSRAMLSSDRKVVEAFIRDTAQFGQNSFKFQDPASSYWNAVTLQYAGSSNYFKLTERGFDDHPIFHLGPDVVVRNGGVLASYTQTVLNGVPVIAVPGASSGSLITIGGTFYYAARLDTATFEYSLTALDTYSRTNTPYADTIGDIPLIEVFEY